MCTVKYNFHYMRLEQKNKNKLSIGIRVIVSPSHPLSAVKFLFQSYSIHRKCDRVNTITSYCIYIYIIYKLCFTGPPIPKFVGWF